MKPKIGQRWRWKSTHDTGFDLILEIYSIVDRAITFHVVQVVYSKYPKDKIGREFVFSECVLNNDSWELLSGQDKPQPNIDWDSEIVFSKMAPDGTLNVWTDVTLPYPVEYISMTLKI